MIETEWFNTWDKPNYPPVLEIVTSVYSPVFGNPPQEDARCSASVTLGSFITTPKKEKCLVLLSVKRPDKMDAQQIIQHIKCLNQDYINNTEREIPSNRNPDKILFEKGLERNPELINALMRTRKVSNLVGFDVKRDSRKQLTDRINTIVPLLKDKLVYLVSDSKTKELRSMDSNFVDYLSAFPNPEVYSLTAAFVNAVLYFESTGFFRATKPTTSKKTPYYGSS